MKKYNTYHSTIKTSYAFKDSKADASPLFVFSFPKSTSQKWKELIPDKFVGNEFASQVENDLEKVKPILDERVKKMTAIFYVFRGLYFTVIEFISKKNFKKIILHPTVVVSDQSMTEKENELHHKANEFCFISISVNFCVKHIPFVLVK